MEHDFDILIMTNSSHFQSLLKHTNYRVVLILQCQGVTEMIKYGNCVAWKKNDILQETIQFVIPYHTFQYTFVSCHNALYLHYI